MSQPAAVKVKLEAAEQATNRLNNVLRTQS